MAIKLRTLALVSVIGGGSCIGIPLILRKSSSFDVSNQSSSLGSSSSSGSQGKATRTPNIKNEEGNCDVANLSRKWEDFLRSRGQRIESYVEITCSQAGFALDNKFSYGWTGLFPRHVLREGETLAEGRSLYIQTKTVEAKSENNYQTTFSGKGMKTKIEGIWKPLIQFDKVTVELILLSGLEDGPKEIYILPV